MKRRLVIFLVVVAILLVIADRVACRVAQDQIAQQVQNTEQLATPAKVTVHGFPFLTQALRGRYTRIDADLSDLTVQDGLPVDSLHVELRGLRLKLADAVNGATGGVPVDSATGTATVSYSSLDAAAKAAAASRNLTLKFGPGQNNQVAVTGDLKAAQLTLRIDAQARVSVQRGRLVVALPAATLADLPASVRGQVTSLVGAGYELPQLPFGFVAKTLTVGSTGVSVRADATSVTLG